MSTPTATTVRQIMAALLALMGLRGLWVLVQPLIASRHHQSLVGTPVLVPLLLLPCILLAVAYLLVFRRFRPIAWGVIVISLLSWLPIVVHLGSR